MSKTIDQRVVEMRFDNQNFESNVKTSMSTLDKLKKSLNLKDSSKGLESVSTAAKKVDFSGLNSGIETVQAKFSSLQIIGITALSNITNAAMNAGKNIISSFTIAPITSGFKEYELQMNSVQTILANTASKGTTINDVTAALDELNTYADLTIYNFAEMTRNIGTFTAAGVDLDKSVAAIKGIANLGAMSGSSSAQVNTAMYQLSQALATGKVSLMDWNSVVNAGMGGEQFQNALKRTAENFGTNVDELIEKYGSFKESLTEGGWLTAEVLTETLNQISGAYSEADLIQQGYSKKQAQEIVQMAETATDAATKVKTFTQLLDTMKEAAGSGWAKTWQILLGDFEEAKNFFTDLSDYFGEMIGASSDSRNELLSGAMDSNWTKLSKEIEKAGLPLDTFTDKLEEVAKKNDINLDSMIEKYGTLDSAMSNIPNSGQLIVDTLKSFSGMSTKVNGSTEAMTDKLEYFQEVVDEVWKGTYKNQPEREKLLTEAGYNYAEVQTLVNKTVDGHRLTLEDLSETQLKAIGYTDEQCKAISKLAKEAEKSGTSINKLIEDINKPSGRVLFLETIKNTIMAILEPLKAIKKAFNEVFSIDSNQIYGMVESLHRFSEAVLMDEDTLDKLTRTFKGIFGIIKIFTSFLGGGLGLAFNILTGILENFNLGILDVTAFIGDLLYGFSDFITSGNLVKTAIEGIGTGLQWAFGWASGFISEFSKFPSIQNSISRISDFFEKIYKYFSNLSSLTPSEAINKFVDDIKNLFQNLTWEDVISGLETFGEKIRSTLSSIISGASSLGPDIIEGLQNGLSDNVGKVFEKMKEIGGKILEAIKAVLGIHSPSTEFFEIGKNIIDGLINGIRYVLSSLFDLIGGVADDIIEIFNKFDWGSILAVAGGAGAFTIFYKITSAFEKFGSAAEALTSPLKSLNNFLNTIGESLSKDLKARAFQRKADAVLSLAKALAILVGAIVILTFLDINKVWGAVSVVGALAGIMAVLAVVVGKFIVDGNILSNLKLNAVILSIGTAFLMLAATMKIISTMSWDDMGKAATGMAFFTVIIGALVAVTKYAGNDLDKAATFIKKITTAFLLLVLVSKIIATMSWDDMIKAAAGITFFGGIIVGLIAATSLAGDKKIKRIGITILKIGEAMLLLTAVAKIIATMSWDDMIKAAAGITFFGGIIVGLIAATKLVGNKELDKIGKTLLMIAGAITILSLTAKIIASMSWEDIGKAGVGITFLSGIIVGLVAITKLASDKELKNLSTTLLAMSASIAILAAVAVLLGMVDTRQLAKGIVAVGLLSLLVTLMVRATKDAKNVKKLMVGIAIAIGVMAASITVLSFIDPTKITIATGALALLMGMFALIVKSTKNVKTSMKTIILLSSVIALLSVCLYKLAGLKADSLISSALALSTLLITMTIVCKALSTIKKVSGSALGAIAILTLIVAGLGAVLGVMAYFNVEGSIQTALAISTLLVTMTIVCKALSTIKEVSSSALIAMGALTLIVAGLGAVLGVMAYFNVEGSIQTALAISTLLVAMSASCLILSKCGSVSSSALGAIAILTLVVAGIGAVLGLLTYFNVAPSLETALALSTLLLAMTAAVAILSLIGPAASGAIAGAASLVAVIGIIAAAVAAFGAIAQIPGAEWIVTEGGDFLQKIGKAIGQFIGGLIGGIGEGITSSLPAMADNLSDFMDRINPFIEGAKQIDPSSMDGVKALAEAILIITAGELLDSIASFITGESSMDDFADKIVAFGEGMKGYSEAVSGIDTESVSASATAGKALAELANTLPKEGGLAGAIFGETTDLDEFGEQLLSFGESIKAYSLVVTGMDTEAVTASATAGQALAELANSLPKEGGLAAAIFGETKDLDEFGEELVSFGKAIKAYSLVVTGMDTEAVTASATAGQALSELANSLPKEGGLAAAIFGETEDLDDFGEELVGFGESIKAYSLAVKGIDIEAIEDSVDAGKALSDLANTLPTDGGLSSAIFGDTTDLDDFGDDLESFGDSLCSYSESVDGLDVDPIEDSVDAGKALSDLASALPNDSGWIGDMFGGQDDLANFGGKLKSFGTALKEYSDSLSTVVFGRISTATNRATDIVNFAKENSGLDTSGLDKVKDVQDILGKTLSEYYDYVKDLDIDKIKNSIVAMRNIANFITSLSDFDSSGISSFETAISELENISFEKVADTFSDYETTFSDLGLELSSMLAKGLSSGQTYILASISGIMKSAVKVISNMYQTFKNSGTFIASNLAMGFRSKTSLITSSFSHVLTSSSMEIRRYYSDFYNSGRYLVLGLANGISENTYLARAKASAMAFQAAEAAKLALDEHSPSKVFYEIGDYAGLAFVNALDDYQEASKKSGTNMAESAKFGLRNAMSNLSSLLSSDIDTNPTIRPVIDLSNVKNGVSEINRTLNGVSPVRSIYTANSISRSIPNIQNGNANDIVSAINKLSKDLGKVGGNSYNVNGVTYDDGSNVSEAVKTLVRAVKIERRV